jgi:antitoxin MazE
MASKIKRSARGRATGEVSSVGKVLVEMSNRGTITLPKRFRSAALFEVCPMDDGSLSLVPQAAINASQSWFWTARWQRMEREADADVQAGSVKQYASSDEFIAELDKL